ncbi:hypothetical protein T08_8030 [Trichinella sp. T8]|nr:hypothetical protein T08_8030 [Trichinella sp. T8]
MVWFAIIQRFVVARAETTSQDDQSITGYRVTLSIAYSPSNDGTHKPQHHLGAPSNRLLDAVALLSLAGMLDVTARKSSTRPFSATEHNFRF